MTPNVKATEKIALVGVVNPQTVANTELFSGVIDLAAYHQALGIALLGNMASETIDFKCYRCDADGSNAVAIKSATQLAASAAANDNKQILMNLTADELMASQAQYIKFGLVTGGATGGPACVVGLGVDSRFGPVTQATSVVEVKA